MRNFLSFARLDDMQKLLEYHMMHLIVQQKDTKTVVRMLWQTNRLNNKLKMGAHNSYSRTELFRKRRYALSKLTRLVALSLWKLFVMFIHWYGTHRTLKYNVDTIFEWDVLTQAAATPLWKTIHASSRTAFSFLALKTVLFFQVLSNSSLCLILKLVKKGPWSLPGKLACASKEDWLLYLSII